MNQLTEKVLQQVCDIVSDSEGDPEDVDYYDAESIVETVLEGQDDRLIAFVNFVIKEGWVRNEENHFNWVKTDDEGFVKEQITQYQLVQMFNDKYK